jgi:hypothetical protein
MIEDLRVRIDFIETRVDGIDDFYEEFAQAAVIVPILFGAEDIISLASINANYDSISISATSIDYVHLVRICLNTSVSIRCSDIPALQVRLQNTIQQTVLREQRSSMPCYFNKEGLVL